MDRADAQNMINQIGRAMEELARATAATAHLFRDMQLGEAPGQFRLRNRPHPDFAPFVNDQN